MKIGLVRHFKVDTEVDNGLINSKKYVDIMTEYDVLNVIPCEVDLRGISWNKCYASSLPRAIETAETIYNEDIIISDLIKEVDIRFNKDLDGEYEYFDWLIHSMFGWLQNKDYVEEGVEETRERVLEFLDILKKENDKDSNILVVCHGLVMRILEQELKKQGFEGEMVVSSDNGDLYLLEK